MFSRWLIRKKVQYLQHVWTSAVLYAWLFASSFAYSLTWSISNNHTWKSLKFIDWTNSTIDWSAKWSKAKSLNWWVNCLFKNKKQLTWVEYDYTTVPKFSFVWNHPWMIPSSFWLCGTWIMRPSQSLWFVCWLVGWFVCLFVCSPQCQAEDLHATYDEWHLSWVSVQKNQQQYDQLVMAVQHEGNTFGSRNKTTKTTILVNV